MHKVGVTSTSVLLNKKLYDLYMPHVDLLGLYFLFYIHIYIHIQDIYTYIHHMCPHTYNIYDMIKDIYNTHMLYMYINT